MREILVNGDLTIAPFHNYVVRDSKLYVTTKFKGIEEGEIFCDIALTPSTPADFILYRCKKVNKTNENMWGYEELFDVTNYDYITPFHIKNIILGIGEFYDWYDIGTNKNK
jgi:hypothetical protein